MTWLVGIYIVSLFLLLITAFWVVNPFTSRVSPGFTLDNFISPSHRPGVPLHVLRTLGMALTVTAISGFLCGAAGYLYGKDSLTRLFGTFWWSPSLAAVGGVFGEILAMRLVFTEAGLYQLGLWPLGFKARDLTCG
jgi:putative spermidine/putrescine transport system permease protein